MIAAITPDRYHHLEPLSKYFDYPIVFFSTPKEALVSIEVIEAVIFLGDWTYDLSHSVFHFKNRRIPTILLMDGTIEWNHFFENPKWSHGGREAPYFPVYCDKIFTPGLSTARFLEFFGNRGKCEATGLPRFDWYGHWKEPQPVNSKSVINVGVLSANTHGYTDYQIKQSIDLFSTLYNVLSSNNTFEIKWRLRKGFHEKLHFDVSNCPEGSLKDFVDSVDVVISQPSTAAYEAMMLGKATAIADFGSAPNYMRGAWEIRRAEHILPILQDMVEMPKHKKLLQSFLLHDTFINHSSSSEVCALVIKDMIDHVKSLKSNEWYFPENMAAKYTPTKASDISLAHYYELSEVDKLSEDLVKANVKISQLENKLFRRGFGFWMERIINRLAKRL